MSRQRNKPIRNAAVNLLCGCKLATHISVNRAIMNCFPRDTAYIARNKSHLHFCQLSLMHRTIEQLQDNEKSGDKQDKRLDRIPTRLFSPFFLTMEGTGMGSRGKRAVSPKTGCSLNQPVAVLLFLSFQSCLREGQHGKGFRIRH